jgi:hypothetical protein
MSHAVNLRHQFVLMSFYIMKIKFEAYSGKLYFCDVVTSDINWYRRLVTKGGTLIKSYL